MNTAITPTTPIEYSYNDRYINRELSILDFHLRVLEQAVDPLHPLLERMNFLLIFSRNLDEFFEIRVAGVMEQFSLGNESRSPDGLTPRQVLQKISETAHAAIERQYRILNEEILPKLREEDICFLRRGELTPAQSAWIKKYFQEQVAPVLTPISLDPAHPFPRLVNKSLNFIVTLEGKDAFGRQIDLAVVPAPRSLPRVVRLPDELTGGKEHHVMLSAIIHEHVSDLFPGMTATGCYQFRVTRNADLALNEDVEDLAKALKGELSSRRFGRAVRLEVTHNCPQHIYEYLLEEFDLTDEQLYKVDGPVNLARLVSNFKRPHLRYDSHTPVVPKVFKKTESIFSAMQKQDILLHHPFESFAPVIQLLRESARDPQVLAIKQTLYRSGADSEIVQILAEAARNGKEVTAVIELRARFDEESNIEVANVLQEAGAVVVYGIVGYKTHAKMIMVVRRENNKLVRYVHLGTGNYHAMNARIYTDYGLMTTDKDLCEDVHRIFQELTGMGKMAKLKKLLHAPFTLHAQLINFIDEEIANAKAGRKAQIIVKVNALTEVQLINKLYEASQAGVQIDLIIRSICCLRPGLPNLSENIRVRSIVGRFLEHTRVYYFSNNGDARIYCSSADWMDRNLFNRVEACFPVEDPALKKRIYQQGLVNYLQDNQQAWLLQSDGTWVRAEPAEGEKLHNAQRALLEIIK
ncbi:MULTISPECIES: polyphosphate kinase 1 [Acinetobacter calcoaceticus/baumannii complex]|uniref:Polyphosphate kinase n=1 Tax=Acinetobacter lactucae TaxID=1785128 RepID=A0A151YQR6_9GAMM|nr:MULTISPECIES: polyphosphate kinase 1 [Acinetobacter calcoaceticus/baumannii complex]ARD29781.1 RNA degradosome polyphosphate kinase [Acinetobacter lactucae]EOQ75703.1 polyphosphate kinase [Acinetobacter lactucae]ETR95705.1 polyphosphate kinase 1 [Acinetobacter lactucae]KYQ80589.1 RNA degradosome polyphosphate kinase [Acinetobacter lactucae]MBJ8438219.1 polyphosphate kinase 1 [Acinetobacter lactucae]